MLYIVTEDRNSARDFWECVATTFKETNEFILVPLPIDAKTNTVNGGNTTLKTQVSNIFPKMKKGDTLFVAFDVIGKTTDFNPVDFINKTRSRCIKNGINFRYTTYYCFEEILLSYDELLEMYKKGFAAGNYVLDALQYVNDCINNHIDYFNNDSRIQNFIANRNEAGHNREHFTNQLLIKATEALKGHFKMSKRTGAMRGTGECWITDCGVVQKNWVPEQVQRVCNESCLYCCKNQSGREKLMDLNNRSLFRNSNIQLYQI